MVHYAVFEAEKRGDIHPGDTIVEASSGNTGVALAMIAAVKGYDAVIIVPDSTSRIKIKMMEAYGAQIHYTSANDGVNAAVMKANMMSDELNAFLLNQFNNQDNILAQVQTGKEILAQIEHVDVFVAGVGTGGTLIGISQALKEANPKTKVFAIEPALAPAFYNMFYDENLPISDGIPHKIEGIGESFVPKILENNRKLVDGVILVTDHDAFQTQKRLALEEGLFAGISSGANIWAALRLAEDVDSSDNIVTILPDTGQRYLE